MASAATRECRRLRRRTAGGLCLALAALLLGAAQAQAGTTLTVNTLADNPISVLECTGGPGDCSLREALDRAISGDTVLIPASASPYVLAKHVITVPGGVSIVGAGSSSTTISGNGETQVFNLVGPQPVTIKGLTITRGHNGSGKDEGGAINDRPPKESGGGLTLEDVTISDSDSTGGAGGALEVEEGDVVIRHSRFIDNSARSGEATYGGGAIDDFANQHALTISDSVFTGNTFPNAAGGALLLQEEVHLAVTSSTFSANTAGGGESGGAIALEKGPTATIVNSTFTNNTAGRGGAISSEAAQLSLVNDTLAANGAEVGANLAVVSGVGKAENTIFSAPFGGGANCAGKLTSEGHNLEDASPGSCGLSAAGDVLGANPLLGALADNASLDATAGGPPQTLALTPGSRAIDAGASAGCTTAGSVDERGVPRPAAPGTGCDIGAFELATVTSSTAISSSHPSSPVGQPLTLVATVAPAGTLPAALSPAFGGSVEFRDGTASLGRVPVDASGRASITTASLASGGHSITAVFSGDGVHLGSTSPALAQVVLPPAPVITKLSQSHKTWREGRGLAKLASRRRAPVGTAFDFTLSTPSTLVLSFSRSERGRQVGHRCVAPGRRNAHHRHCLRLLPAGKLTFANARAGGNRIVFQGRIAGTKRLGPGRYAVVLTATNAGGRSAPLSLSFTIAAH